MWQFSVLCYHSPIETHNNFFFHSQSVSMESYQVVILLMYGVISRGNHGLPALKVFTPPSSGRPRASSASQQHKGTDSIMKWHLEACRKNHAASKEITQNVSSPFISSCLTACLWSQWVLMCCSGKHKTDKCVSSTKVRSSQGHDALNVTENFSFGLNNFIDLRQLVQNWRDNSAHTAA